MKAFQKFVNKILYFLYPNKVYGAENITEGCAIIICNHLHALDPIYISKVLKEDVKFLAKKELFEKPIVSSYVKGYGAIPIDRDNPDMKSLLAVIKELKQNKKIVIFPEGTRNKTETTVIQNIKSGTGVFAVKAKCPIIPVIIEKKSKMLRKNRVLFGKPFELSSFYDVKLSPEIIESMDKVILDKMRETQYQLSQMPKGKKK